MSVDLQNRQTDGRARQRARTADAVLVAAAELLRGGSTPTVAQAAERSGVSQATAYRYFPTQRVLLAAVVDREMREAMRSLEGSIRLTGEPEADLVRLAHAVFLETGRREHEHRSLLRLALDAWFSARAAGTHGVPVHRGGRIPFIVDALEPLRPRVSDAALTRLAEAVSLAIGIEARLVLRDIWRLPSHEAADVIAWTCRSLVRQTLAEADSRAAPPSAAARRALARARRRNSEARGTRIGATS